MSNILHSFGRIQNLNITILGQLYKFLSDIQQKKYLIKDKISEYPFHYKVFLGIPLILITTYKIF